MIQVLCLLPAYLVVAYLYAENVVDATNRRRWFLAAAWVVCCALMIFSLSSVIR